MGIVETIFSSDCFDFVTFQGIGIRKTPYTEKRVISKGLALKWGVHIDLLNGDIPNFMGEPVEYTYRYCSIKYDLAQCSYGTCADIDEFISVLRSAQEFKRKIDEYMGFLKTNLCNIF